jgi:hypothetical protein
MTSLKQIGVWLVAVIVGGASFGGVYSNVQKDFSEGISVDGTVIIDGSGNIDAPITSTTGTFSSTLGVTGAATLSGAVQVDDTLTVGVDDTGYDVNFFGATAGQKFFWDESADTLFLPATIDVDGTITVGVDGTGFNVKAFGDTASAYMEWTQSTDTLNLAGSSKFTMGTGLATLGPTLYKEETEDVAGDNVLTAAESGKTLYMGTAGEDQTLPAPADGVVFRFVVQENVATTNMVIQGPAADASDDIIYGSVEVAGSVVLCSAEDTLTFVAETNEAIPGDYVELRSDGTKWYLSGHVSTASAFTCADAD